MGRLMTLKEWRKWRDQSGELLALVIGIERRDPELGAEARRIYEAWLKFRLSYKEARARLKKLAQQDEELDNGIM